MKRILVTGSTGFVGSNVVEKLVKKKYEVIAHGRTVKPWTPKCVTDRLIEIDFDKEKYELGEFDAVVNCLSVINPKDYSWEEFEYPNCSITYSISKKISCAKFIHLSTCSVLSKKSISINQPDPINLYGLSKYVSEKIVEIERKGKNSIILRFPIIIGKNKQNQDFVRYIINQAKQGKTIELFGKGLHFRNVLHVSEVVKAIISTIESNNIMGFDTVTVGSSNALTINDICKYLLKKIKSKSKILLIDKKALNDFDAFINVKKSALINYNCLSIQENIDFFIRELEL